MLGMIAIIFFFLIVTAVSYSTDTGKASLRKSFLIACIFSSVTLVLITEVLSYLEVLNLKSLTNAWIIACFLLILTTLAKKSTRRKFKFNKSFLTGVSSFHNDCLASENGLIKSAQILCFLTVLAIATITLVASFVSPPNTYDSMTYHMSRVAHWMANQSLAHYPTSIGRQLDQPPFAGLVILNFQILTRGDYFANLVQWISFLSSSIGVSLIAKHLGGNNRVQVFAIFFCATIPMGILQSSTTQNDYVASFWLVCYVYFLMVWTSQPGQVFNLIMLSFSLGLALLTKGTAYIYVFPASALGFMLFLRQWRKQKLKYLMQAIVLGPSIALLLNASHWLRNASLFGPSKLLGISGTATLTQNLNLQLYLSNIIKNASLHLVFPSGFVNQLIQNALALIHALLRVDINAPETTFRYSPQFQYPAYEPTFFHEDFSGNVVHFLLLSLSLLVIFTKRKSFSREILYYSWCILGLIFIYSFFIAWQPWASRLHLPIFILASPIIAIFFTGVFMHRHKIIQRCCALFLIALSYASTPYLFSNSMKPLSKIFNTPRVEQYFAASSHLSLPYINAVNYLDAMNCENVGLSLGGDDYEYPLWAISRMNGLVDRRLTHLDVNNGSEVARSNRSITNYCAVLASNKGKPEPAKEQNLSFDDTVYSLVWSQDQVGIYLPNP